MRERVTLREASFLIKSIPSVCGGSVRARLWLSVLTCFVAVSVAHAQESIGGARQTRPELSGEIPLEQAAPQKRSGRSGGKREVVEWATALAAATSASSGGVVPQLSDLGVEYLSGVYLFCTAKRGVCGFIPESILEAEVLAARAGGAQRCAIMNRFWAAWLAIDGDKRSQYLVPLGDARAVAEFNSTVRPRFVRCKDSVTTIIDGKEALAQRFGPGTESAKSTATLAALLEEISANHIDVFAESGM